MSNISFTVFLVSMHTTPHELDVSTKRTSTVHVTRWKHNSSIILVPTLNVK